MTPGSLRTFGQESHSAEAQVAGASISSEEADAARRYIARYVSTHGLGQDVADGLAEMLGVAA